MINHARIAKLIIGDTEIEVSDLEIDELGQSPLAACREYTIRPAEIPARSLEPTIDMSGFPIPIRIVARDAWGAGRRDSIEYRASMSAREAETWEPIEVQADFLVPRHALDDKPLFASIVRDKLVQFLAHEVEECLKIDGEFAFDPHGARGKP